METRVILVLFYKETGSATIEKLLDEVGPSFLQRAQVFQECPALYAVQVLADTANEWKTALAQLPEVAWTECVGSPVFAPDRAA